MAYYFIENRLGMQDVTESSTVQKHPLGTIARAKDGTFGEAEFLYALGIVNTTIGNVVTYDPNTYLTTLCAVGGNIPRPVAIAMSANGASAYGWYQVSGIAVVKKSCTISLLAGAAVAVLTTGLIAGTGTGKEIQGAAVAAVASAAAGRVSVQVMLARPHKQGRIT